MEPRPPFISRIIIKNYKSIARCDVHLGALQFLVGRNGSGKSNFLDALAFVRDLFTYPNIGEVLQRRIDVLHRKNFVAGGWDEDFSIYLECNLPDGAVGMLEIVINALEFAIKSEKCVIKKNSNIITHYETRDRKLITEPFPNSPPPSPDRLYLQTFGSDAYRPLYDGLRQIQIYRIDTAEITQRLMSARSGNFSLNESGDNLSAIWYSQSRKTQDRINEYMQIVVPSVYEVGVKELLGDDHLLLLEFLMNSGTGKPTSSFHAPSMSDGTLRALGVLVALLQERKNGGGNFPALVCIEEPETGLHAHAFGALLGAMQEASDMRQVIVATHSADMLDDKEITPDQILAVEMQNSETIIAPVENLTKRILQKHLTTAGELLRQDKLKPAQNNSPVKKELHRSPS